MKKAILMLLPHHGLRCGHQAALAGVARPFSTSSIKMWFWGWSASDRSPCWLMHSSCLVLPGCTLEIGGGGDWRCSLSHLKGHAGHHTLFMTAALPFPPLSMGKSFARHEMPRCGRRHLTSFNGLPLHQSMENEPSSRIALLSSLNILLGL